MISLLDSFGNYNPGIVMVEPTVSGGAESGMIGHGSGAPGDSTPSYYSIYIDDDAGSMYIYVDGEWVLFTSGGGGSIVTSETDPNGSVSASGPAICIGTGAADGFLWKKVTAGISDDEWIAL